MSQKKLYVAAIVAGTAALAGCDLSGGLPSGTITTGTPTPAPNVSPTPFKFTGFPSNATLTGRITFEGGDPGSQLSVKYKTPGGSAQSIIVKTNEGGYFNFSTIPAGTGVQAVWDDDNKNVVTDADFNVAGVYVSDPVQTVSNPDAMTPMITMDIKWKPNPTPGLNATTNGTFSFSRIPNLDATYQIAIFDTNQGAIVTKTVADGAGSTDMTTDSAYSALTSGNYLYQIKFFKKGGTFGGSNFYGSTKYLPFKK